VGASKIEPIENESNLFFAYLVRLTMTCPFTYEKQVMTY